MNLLLDTHLLLWAAIDDPLINPGDPLPRAAADLIDDESNTLHFSAASIWEVAIKAGRGKDDFRLEPQMLHRSLLDNGYVELAITARHAAGVRQLPDLHRDPFDRILVSQATCEGMLLVTADAKLAAYPGPIQRV